MFQIFTLYFVITLVLIISMRLFFRIFRTYICLLLTPTKINFKHLPLYFPLLQISHGLTSSLKKPAHEHSIVLRLGSIHASVPLPVSRLSKNVNSFDAVFNSASKQQINSKDTQLCQPSSSYYSQNSFHLATTSTMSVDSSGITKDSCHLNTS